MTLRHALDAVAASAPIEAALLARERPILARASGADAAAACALAVALDTAVFVIAAGPREAETIADDATAFLPGVSALLPAWEALPYEGISPSAEVAARRAEAMRALAASSGAFVLVAPVLAALHAVAPTLGSSAPLVVEVGTSLPPDALAERLVELGYARADVVEHRGEFAVRGGVLDVFPGTDRRPTRLEYWGDEVESIRAFSASTQLSTTTTADVRIGQVRELVPDEAIRARATDAARTQPGRIGDLLARIGDGLHPEGMETTAPFLFDRLACPADLLPDGAWVVLADAPRTLRRADHAHDDAEALAASIAWPGPPVVRPLDEALGDRVRVDLTGFTEGLDLGFSSWGTAQGNPAELAARLRELAGRDRSIWICGRAAGSLARLGEVLGDVPATAVQSSLASGFVHAAGVAIATEEDVFGSRRHTRDAPRFTARRADHAAEDLEPGDHAVHRIHGVGRFLGVVHRELAGAERDYLVIEYAAKDKLYVPSDAVGMVARYVGGESPRVMRMGGSDWARATAKVKRAVRDMAGELVRLYTVRMAVPGRAFGPDTPWQGELEDAFPYAETPDQLRVIDEVKRDMESAIPMDRLLCGDVGFGKTEVALRAAFKAVMDGTQVAVLVPTTLLAEQHLLTFEERFRPYPVTVRMLSRFVDPAAQRRVVEDLVAGRVDVVIGTHRLLGRDVGFKELGLLVIDEEQRFGVSHKERLKAMRAQVDVLTMTATPIPRTLEMALTGIRGMSTIDTPPEDRQPVLTYVGSFDDDLALGAVRRELLREGQVFWVHNRVATIERRAAWLRDRIPDAQVVVAHGQMDEDQLERRMVAFWEREADVLVCTTIIESGLDVPNANTLVVDRADMLGLAQLYQLRGRVGRSSERAFAYLFFPSQREMTEEASQRLATIAHHQELGSGFRIAMRDLEIRGAGNLLGAEQSGHIAAVGFDAYARILRESVHELQGELPEPEAELRIDLPVKAFVPPGWLAQESLRLELYRRIGNAADHGVLAEIRTETVDRFGGLPEQVEVLFQIASLRLTGARLRIREIATFREQVRLSPLELTETQQLGLPERIVSATYHAARSTLNLAPERLYGKDLVGWVEARLREAVGEDARPGLEPSVPDRPR